jgi:DNA-binding beta-propeller fold protein YncE
MTGQLNNPTGIAVDVAGDLFVLDTWNLRVQKFDAAGNFLLQLGGFGTDQGQFSYPEAIAADAANVYVADVVNDYVDG